jgi:hypothetical protein
VAVNWAKSVDELWGQVTMKADIIRLKEHIVRELPLNTNAPVPNSLGDYAESSLGRKSISSE